MQSILIKHSHRRTRISFSWKIPMAPNAWRSHCMVGEKLWFELPLFRQGWGDLLPFLAVLGMDSAHQHLLSFWRPCPHSVISSAVYRQLSLALLDSSITPMTPSSPTECFIALMQLQHSEQAVVAVLTDSQGNGSRDGKWFPEHIADSQRLIQTVKSYYFISDFQHHHNAKLSRGSASQLPTSFLYLALH